jgi:hypothetical protein
MKPNLMRRGVVGLVLVVAGLGGALVAQQRAATVMARSATAFLASLTAEQRQKATFALASEELTKWHFVPTNQFPRNGLALREMTEPQRERARELLRASLSQRGFMTATSIMDLENVLHEIEGGRGTGAAPGWPYRDPLTYFFSVFGEPTASGTWGYRIEGHHMSLHFVIKGSTLQVASSPTFFGSNPGEVREGPKAGLRVLGAQEDAARALLDALTAAQKTTVQIGTVAAGQAVPTPPGELVTRNLAKVDPLTPPGVSAADMTPAQRDLLVKLIDVFAGALPDEIAAERMTKIRTAGLEKVTFAWAGSFEKGQRYHFRVQGPTFLIEHNNTQNNGNHVHSVWRDFAGDFGRDLIAEHMAMVQH